MQTPLLPSHTLIQIQDPNIEFLSNSPKCGTDQVDYDCSMVEQIMAGNVSLIKRTLVFTGGAHKALNGESLLISTFNLNF